ncbi:MAG: hypothetical protein KIT81_06985 [Alphaproteobacteria bacterium]|nr:hypothetical protein [Alphaproteobacteria bacterium]
MGQNMADAALLVRSFKVGRRIVTMTIPQIPARGLVCMSCEWAPDAPRRLSKRELREYRQGRDAVLAEISEMIGGRVAVAEV